MMLFGLMCSGSSSEDGEMQTDLRSILNVKVRGLTDGLNGQFFRGEGKEELEKSSWLWL